VLEEERFLVPWIQCLDDVTRLHGRPREGNNTVQDFSHSTLEVLLVEVAQKKELADRGVQVDHASIYTNQCTRNQTRTAIHAPGRIRSA
jgi:hypothetical protein